MKKITFLALAVLLTSAYTFAQTPFASLKDSTGQDMLTIPGKIETEYYDEGGEYDETANPTGAYFDGKGRIMESKKPNNAFDAFRPTEDMGVQRNDTTAMKGIRIGFFRPEDWTLYSVNVTPGDYKMTIRYAFTSDDVCGAKFALLDKATKDTVEVIFNDALDQTTGWFDFNDTTMPVTIKSSGEYYLSYHTHGKNAGIDYVYFGDEALEYTTINKTNANNLSVYPNPVATDLTISGLTENAVVSIYNSVGAMVKTTNLLSNSNTINVSDLNSGLYFMTVKSNTLDIVKKIIVE